MRVHTGVASCTRQILSVAVWNVLARLGLTESLGETKVNDINEVLLLADANEEVVWFDVSMQEVARVNELKSLQLKE